MTPASTSVAVGFVLFVHAATAWGQAAAEEAPPAPAVPPAAEAPAETEAPAESAAPALQPIEEISLEDLLGEKVASGDTGSFGLRLDRLKTSVFLHGYATLDYVNQGASHQFDAHYFNLLVGANVADVVFPELQLELEHANDFAIRTAQVDAKLADWLVVRGGMFLVPFGVYNEFIYPEYLSKLPRGPLVLTYANLVPVTWNEVGVQVRGKLPLGAGNEFNYAAYLVNGLEQKDGAPKDGVVADGGGIRAMRGNFQDKNHGNKAFGGRLGVTLFDSMVTVGASGYRGVYTAEGGRYLTLLGADLLFKHQGLYVRLDGVVALQERTDPTDPAAVASLQKQGVYAVAAYEVTPWFEPAIAFDRQVLGGAVSANKSRTTLCLNFRPWQQATLVLRASYTLSVPDGGGPRDDILMAQASMGF